MVEITTSLVIICLAAALLGLLLRFEIKDQRKPRLVAKTALSLLFVVAAALQPSGNNVYYWVILAGLTLSLAGDVLLALRGKHMFLAGLVAFLLAHVAYLIAFFSLGVPNPLTGWGGALTVIVGTTVFNRLRPKLGGLFWPVLAYMLVITTMVIGAFTVAGTEDLDARCRALVVGGAVLFYASDLFVARQRFSKREHLNALIGLPLYYAGQFLIAFSVGVV